MSLTPIAATLRDHDRDRFQTALFAPAAHREALLALYAFNYEIARIRELVREPMLGQIRLQWWREVIATAYTGGTPRAHDVVRALTDVIRSRQIDRARFDALIDAREADFAEAPPATLAALENYAEGTAATLTLLALEMLDADAAAAREAARHVGIAYGLTGMLRALPFDEAAGRTFVARHIPVRDIAASAAAHLAAARSLRPTVPAAALPALLPARIAAAALARLARAGFDPRRAAPVDPLQSWRLAWAALCRRF